MTWTPATVRDQLPPCPVGASARDARPWLTGGRRLPYASLYDPISHRTIEVAWSTVARVLNSGRYVDLKEDGA